MCSVDENNTAGLCSSRGYTLSIHIRALKSVLGGDVGWRSGMRTRGQRRAW
jgi:hypothetical protein